MESSSQIDEEIQNDFLLVNGKLEKELFSVLLLEFSGIYILKS